MSEQQRLVTEATTKAEEERLEKEAAAAEQERLEKEDADEAEQEHWVEQEQLATEAATKAEEERLEKEVAVEQKRLQNELHKRIELDRLGILRAVQKGLSWACHVRLAIERYKAYTCKGSALICFKTS